MIPTRASLRRSSCFKNMPFGHLKFILLPWPPPPLAARVPYAFCVRIVKLEASNGAATLALRKIPGKRMILTPLFSSVEDWASLRTMRTLSAAWNHGERTWKAAKFAIFLQCACEVQATSFHDDVWSLFTPPGIFLFWFSPSARHLQMKLGWNLEKGFLFKINRVAWHFDFACVEAMRVANT